MNPTDEAVELATGGLDDDLQPLTTDATTNTKDEPETPVADVETPDAPTEDADTPEEGKDTTDDEGFTADEVEDEPGADEPEAPSDTKTETPDIDTSGLDPEAKYIVDNLPLLTARIKDGDGVKELQVKSHMQLPENVEFASKRDEIAFLNALTAQENRAGELQRQFRQDQQTAQANDFDLKETAAIREDIAALQKEGELPKFKVRADDPKFTEDPATQEVQKILDFMEERNKAYLEEYQAGRPYRHLGFRDAYALYTAANPKRPPAEVKEDAERKEVAKKTSTVQGASSGDIAKPTVKHGTTTRDLLAMIDNEEI